MFKLLLMLLPCAIYAQGNFTNYGNLRVLGSNTDGTNPFWGRTILIGNNSFSGYSTGITERFILTNGANIATQTGALLFYTNGYCVMDKYGNIIPNGDSINATPYSLQDLYGANNFPQSNFIFQHKTDSSLYTMVHAVIENYTGSGTIGPLNLLRTELKVMPDSSIKVVEKNKVLIADTVEHFGITGCKHANGRDWWVIVKKWNSTIHYSLLFTPDSTFVFQNQVNGSPLIYEGSRNLFSNKGDYYVTYSHTAGLRIFSFNRCSGLLEIINAIPEPANGSIAAFGASFTASDKYLYFNNWYNVYRINMQSALQASDVELVREYTYFSDSAFGAGNAYMEMELSNDGKLYIGGTGSCRYFSTIDNPDADNVAQVGFNHFTFQIPYFNNQTLTNHPNYNLGPLAGSPCDTLSLDKNDLLDVNLTTKVFPNPNSGSFTINYSAQAVSGMLYIYNMNGQLVFKEYVAPWSNTKSINLAHQLNDGMHAVKLTFGNKLALGKFVVKK
jgi:hypothetical protein